MKEDVNIELHFAKNIQTMISQTLDGNRNF